MPAVCGTVPVFVLVFVLVFLLLHADGDVLSPLFPAADIDMMATSVVMVVFVCALVPQAVTKTAGQ